MDLPRAREIMKQKNITVNQLANMVDASQRTIDDFLKRGSGSFVLLYKISKALGVTMNELIGNSVENATALCKNPIQECIDQLDKSYAVSNNAPDLTERYLAEVFEKRLPATKGYVNISM